MALSYIDYSGTGSLTEFSVPFDYISEDDIEVYVAGVLVTPVFISKGTIQVDPAPTSEQNIRIRRRTTQDRRLVTFNGGFSKDDLELSHKQAFFLAQEAIDEASDVLGIGEDGTIDAMGIVFNNIAPPTQDGHAVTLGYLKMYYESPLSGLKAAAENAKALAEQARDEAVTARNQAELFENQALAHANVATEAKLEAQAARDIAEASILDAAQVSEDRMVVTGLKGDVELLKAQAVTASTEAVTAKIEATQARDTTVTAKNQAVAAATQVNTDKAIVAGHVTAVTTMKNQVSTQASAVSSDKNAVTLLKASVEDLAGQTTIDRQIAVSAKNAAELIQTDVTGKRTEAVNAATQATQALAQINIDKASLDAAVEEAGQYSSDAFVALSNTEAARDIAIQAANQAEAIAGGGGVKVSATDGATNYLIHKLEGEGINLTVVDDGAGNERVKITADLSLYSTTEQVNAKIAEVIGSSPETLDTLQELAEALGNDPNFATTVMDAVGLKVDKTFLTTNYPNYYYVQQYSYPRATMDSFLSAKADVTHVDEGLVAKADKSYVDTELAKKANTSNVNSALALKADITSVDSALGITLSSAQDYTDTAVAPKADKSYVDTQLATKADTSSLAAIATSGSFSALTGIPTNATGNRTISTADPSGGSDGDIWYKVD